MYGEHPSRGRDCGLTLRRVSGTRTLSRVGTLEMKNEHEQVSTFVQQNEFPCLCSAMSSNERLVELFLRPGRKSPTRLPSTAYSPSCGRTGESRRSINIVIPSILTSSTWLVQSVRRRHGLKTSSSPFVRQLVRTSQHRDSYSQTSLFHASLDQTRQKK